MPKELAPTSVLEARERDEELAFKADLEENALVTVGVQSEVIGSEMGGQNVDLMVSEEVCMPVVGSVVPDSDFGKGRLGKVSSSEGNVGSTSGKRQGVVHVQERLDRYFCNQDWHNLYPLVRVINGDLIHSDHRPVVASLENVIRNPQNDRKRCFRFETHWLKDDDCHDIVHQTWLAPNVSSPCADQLGRGIRECYWKLRSRADWLALGDRNIKYFHNKATGRKKKNAIVEIMTEDGRRLSTEEDIVGEIERYFGTIFSSASPSTQQVAARISNIETRISSD
ncbi:hypothetical protein G4B88_002596, partial [Cannabis sativa]